MTDPQPQPSRREVVPPGTPAVAPRTSPLCIGQLMSNAGALLAHHHLQDLSFDLDAHPTCAVTVTGTGDDGVATAFGFGDDALE